MAPRQPSGLLSVGLSVATVALNVAGAATDAVPIAKQILNSAAHISAAAERIQKKREAMYLLVEKADVYATQIDIAVAGRILDSSLQRRLERLYDVFLSIEALVNDKVDEKGKRFTRVWRNTVTKPNRAEELALQLDREIQLFEILIGIQLSFAVDDTARVVAADARYEGQFRLLRDCDVEKLETIHERESDEGVIIWASARVDGQLMIVRYHDPARDARNRVHIATMDPSFGLPLVPHHEYLKSITKLSSVHASHQHVVQLYGVQAQALNKRYSAFRSGTSNLLTLLSNNMNPPRERREATALYCLQVAFKILDAAWYLEHTHALAWVGTTASIDDYGEPCIGVFDDIVPYDHDMTSELSRQRSDIYINETGVVEQVFNGYLHSVIMTELRTAHPSLRLLWDSIRQERLHVEFHWQTFPIILGDVDISLSHEMTARALTYFETIAEKKNDPLVDFTRSALSRCGEMSPWMQINFAGGRKPYTIVVGMCTYSVDRDILYMQFTISLPTGSPLVAEVARIVGLPDDFEHSWDGYRVDFYETAEYDMEYVQREEVEGVDSEGEEGEHNLHEDELDNDCSDVTDPEHSWDGSEDDSDACGTSEEEDEEYETADEGETAI